MFRVGHLLPLVAAAALVVAPAVVSSLTAGSKEQNDVPMYLLTQFKYDLEFLRRQLCYTVGNDYRCAYRVNGVGPLARLDKDAVLDMIETNWVVADEPLSEFALHTCCHDSVFFLSPPGTLRRNESVSSQ